MGRGFPFLTGGAGGGGYLPLPGTKCKLHAEKVKFGAYFASYEVAYKVNAHSLVHGVQRLRGGGIGPFAPLWIRHWMAGALAQSWSPLGKLTALPQNSQLVEGAF